MAESPDDPEGGGGRKQADKDRQGGRITRSPPPKPRSISPPTPPAATDMSAQNLRVAATPVPGITPVNTSATTPELPTTKTNEIIQALLKEVNALKGKAGQEKLLGEKAFALASAYQDLGKQNRDNPQKKEESKNNYQEALRYYQMAAELDNADAQLELGTIYEYQSESAFYGLQADPKKAFGFYEKAAKNGNLEAINDVGFCYEGGIGVTKDLPKAFEYYNLAVEKGNPTAITNLGRCYAKGMGVEINFEKAASWFKKAADQGDPYAQNILGDYYERGIGVPQDLAKAIALYKQAAAQTKDEEERARALELLQSAELVTANQTTRSTGAESLETTAKPTVSQSSTDASAAAKPRDPHQSSSDNVSPQPGATPPKEPKELVSQSAPQIIPAPAVTQSQTSTFGDRFRTAEGALNHTVTEPNHNQQTDVPPPIPSMRSKHMAHLVENPLVAVSKNNITEAHFTQIIKKFHDKIQDKKSQTETEKALYEDVVPKLSQDLKSVSITIPNHDEKDNKNNTITGKIENEKTKISLSNPPPPSDQSIIVCMELMKKIGPMTIKKASGVENLVKILESSKLAGVEITFDGAALAQVKDDPRFIFLQNMTTEQLKEFREYIKENPRKLGDPIPDDFRQKFESESQDLTFTSGRPSV